MTVKQLFFICITYFTVILFFSIYWAYNYSQFGTFKGDEFITLAEMLVLLSFLSFLSINIFVSKIHFALVIFLPLLLLAITFLVGTALLLLIKSSEVRTDIIGYSLIYGLSGMISIYLFWYNIYSKKKDSTKPNA